MSKSQREVFHAIREYEGRAIEITDMLHPFSFHAFDSRWKSSAMPTLQTRAPRDTNLRRFDCQSGILM